MKLPADFRISLALHVDRWNPPKTRGGPLGEKVALKAISEPTFSPTGPLVFGFQRSVSVQEYKFLRCLALVSSSRVSFLSEKVSKTRVYFIFLF